jgi:hypothetical protein
MTDEPKPHKIRVEMVYRVWGEIKVTEENYSHALQDALDRDANATIEAAAFASELLHDEDDMYTQFFEEQIASNGPDDVFILIQLLDPDGNVLRQGTIEDSVNEASVRPQYLVSGMEIEHTD